MTEDTENLVLSLLRDIRQELADQQSVLLGSVSSTRRMGEDILGLRGEMLKIRDEVHEVRGEMLKMEHRLDSRLTAVRDDLELMLKSELLGRLTHFETSIDEKLSALSDRVTALEA